MQILITGAAGFAGSHLAASLQQILGADVAMTPTSRIGGRHPVWGATEALDMTDETAVRAAVERHRPTHVIHLAGVAAPARAAENPKAAWRIHLEGTLNLAGAIMAFAPDCVLINAGSGQVYGDSARSGLPLDESALLAPIDHYGLTKAAADLALGTLCAQGLRCIRMRPFNHTGPGQSPSFLIPSIAAQIAGIEAGLAAPVIKIGNLEAERDFLDVRDVVAAYGLAVKAAERIEPGTIINIASGTSRSVRQVLESLLSLSWRKISVEQDQSRFRANDLPRITGDAGRARQLLGWQPRHEFEDTMAAVLEACRANVKAA